MPYQVSRNGSVKVELPEECHNPDASRVIPFQEESTTQSPGLPPWWQDLIDLIISIVEKIIQCGSLVLHLLLNFQDIVEQLFPCLLVDLILKIPQLNEIIAPLNFFGVTEALYETAATDPAFQFFFAKVVEKEKHDLFLSTMELPEMKNVVSYVDQQINLSVIRNLPFPINVLVRLLIPSDIAGVTCLLETILWWNSAESFCDYRNTFLRQDVLDYMTRF